MLLEGGLDWKALSLSPKDMDFAESKAGAAREIALAFGAPPLLPGLPGDNSFANYAEAIRAFWRLHRGIRRASPALRQGLAGAQFERRQ